MENNKMEEHLDLRELVEDEVEYKKLDPGTTNKALRYIRESGRLMEMLDLVVSEAISAVK